MNSFYDDWLEGKSHTQNLGSFQIAMLEAYRAASGTNRSRLDEAYPEWFARPKQSDESEQEKLIKEILKRFEFEEGEYLYHQLIEPLTKKWELTFLAGGIWNDKEPKCHDYCAQILVFDTSGVTIDKEAELWSWLTDKMWAMNEDDEEQPKAFYNHSIGTLWIVIPIFM